MPDPNYSGSPYEDSQGNWTGMLPPGVDRDAADAQETEDTIDRIRRREQELKRVVEERYSKGGHIPPWSPDEDSQLIEGNELILNTEPSEWEVRAKALELALMAASIAGPMSEADREYLFQQADSFADYIKRGSDG